MARITAAGTINGRPALRSEQIRQDRQVAEEQDAIIRLRQQGQAVAKPELLVALTAVALLDENFTSGGGDGASGAGDGSGSGGAAGAASGDGGTGGTGDGTGDGGTGDGGSSGGSGDGGTGGAGDGGGVGDGSGGVY